MWESIFTWRTVSKEFDAFEFNICLVFIKLAELGKFDFIFVFHYNRSLPILLIERVIPTVKTVWTVVYVQLICFIRSSRPCVFFSLLSCLFSSFLFLLFFFIFLFLSLFLLLSLFFTFLFSLLFFFCPFFRFLLLGFLFDFFSFFLSLFLCFFVSFLFLLSYWKKITFDRKFSSFDSSCNSSNSCAIIWI